jgi:hypothetical protein
MCTICRSHRSEAQLSLQSIVTSCLYWDLRTAASEVTGDTHSPATVLRPLALIQQQISMHEAQADRARRTSFSLMERAVAADNKSPPIGDDTSTHGASLHGENAARRQVSLLGCTMLSHAPHVTCCCYYCSASPISSIWVRQHVDSALLMPAGHHRAAVLCFCGRCEPLQEDLQNMAHPGVQKCNGYACTHSLTR